MRGSSIVLAGLLLATSALGARADVEVEIRNGDKVSGTLLPADEVETLVVRLPAGAFLTAVGKGKKAKGSKTAPVVSLRVLDETDTDIAAGLVVSKGTGASVKKLPIATTGLYRVEVTGTTATTGNYLLKVKWKSPKKVVVPVLDLSTGTATVDFATDASALVTFTVKGAKKSTTLPRLERVDALPGGGDAVHTFTAPTDPTATSQKAKKILHPTTATYRVTVNDVSGMGAGAAKLTIAIKAPKGKKMTVDVSDEAIASGPIGGGSVKGVVVDSDGGAILIPPGDSSGIGGAGLLIPGGALPGATPLLIGTGPPIQSSLLPNQSPAGPTVFFGPDGQQFAKDVTSTIPFSAAIFNDDMTTLRVVQMEADGTESIVDVSDYTIDEINGTVSFPTAHFTTFRVFGPLVEVLLGDLDSDGEAEFFMPSINSLGGEGSIALFDMVPSMGYAYAEDADARLQASSLAAGTTGRFGTAFASHDVSGDGVADLVVGAPASDDGGLLVFLGGAREGQQVLEEDFHIRGATLEGFGRSVALGDFDGDGLIDIAGGGSGANDAGTVHVFLGSSGLRTVDTDQSNRAIVGGLAGSLFGHQLAVGDVTGDGLDDLIVPTPRIDSQAGGGGIVQIYAGSDSVTGGLSVQPVAVLGAVGVADEFGSSVDVGDVDGDGTLDVIVGASNAQDGATRPGAVYVFFGGPGLGNATAAQADVTLTGLDDREEFGFAVRVLDFDGDGTDDIAVGSPALQEPLDLLLNAGITTLFYGAPTLADATRGDADATLGFFPAENGRAGARLLPALDYDGDGSEDLVVFIPGVLDQATDGVAGVFQGSATRQTGEVIPSALFLGDLGTFPLD